jgi:hypothetical protein
MQPNFFSCSSWIEAEDTVVDGRISRSAPQILYSGPPKAGLDCRRAQALARALIAAVDW